MTTSPSTTCQVLSTSKARRSGDQVDGPESHAAFGILRRTSGVARERRPDAGSTIRPARGCREAQRKARSDRDQRRAAREPGRCGEGKRPRGVAGPSGREDLSSLAAEAEGSRGGTAGRGALARSRALLRATMPDRRRGGMADFPATARPPAWWRTGRAARRSQLILPARQRPADELRESRLGACPARRWP